MTNYLFAGLFAVVIACGGDGDAPTPATQAAPQGQPSADELLAEIAASRAGGPGAIYVGDLSQLAGTSPVEDIGGFDGAVPLDSLQRHIWVYEDPYYRELLKRANFTNPTSLVSGDERFSIQHFCVSRALQICKLVESYWAPNLLERTNGQLKIEFTDFRELGLPGPDTLFLVGDVIGSRLRRLSESCNQVLRTASVIGRNFDFKLLNALITDISEDRLLGAINEARAAHIIDEVPEEIEHYQFSQAQMQQAFYQKPTVNRRVEIHAGIAKALEALHRRDAEAHAAVLAYHYGEAGPEVGTEKLVYYSRLAGEQALAIYAFDEALNHFQRALTAKNVPLTTSEPAEDAESAALLFGLGRAQTCVLPRNQMHEAVANLKRSFGYFAKN